MSDDAAHRPLYRKKRFWICLILLTPPLILTGLWISGGRELERQLAELREAGMPTNGEELNAFYRVPDDAVDTTELWVAAIRGADNPDLHQSGSELPFIGSGPEPIAGEEWAQLDAARAFLSEFSEELDTIHTAADAGGVARFPVDFSKGLNAILTDVQGTRTVSRLLKLDAHESARDGNDARALRDVVAMFALTDALQAEPSYISQLMRMALHSIGCSTALELNAECQWTGDQLATLQSAIAAADFKQAVRLAMRGERAITLMSIEQLPIGPLVVTNKSKALSFFAESIDALDAPWCEAIWRQYDIAAELAATTGYINKMRYIAVRLIFPATEKSGIAGARSAAVQRCCIAALAAERFRREHGTLPPSLSEISADFFPSDYPASEFSDPLDGKPLKFTSTEAGIIIYSVGDNFVDNGGQVQLDERGGPPDIGFALSQ